MLILQIFLPEHKITIWGHILPRFGANYLFLFQTKAQYKKHIFMILVARSNLQDTCVHLSVCLSVCLCGCHTYLYFIILLFLFFTVPSITRTLACGFIWISLAIITTLRRDHYSTSYHRPPPFHKHTYVNTTPYTHPTHPTLTTTPTSDDPFIVLLGRAKNKGLSSKLILKRISLVDYYVIQT